MSNEIRPEIRALIERGKVTLHEYQELRCNSWEHEALVPAMAIETLLFATTHALHNCSRAKKPASTYEEAIHGVYAPELIRRLKLFQDEREKSEVVLETTHNAKFPCRFCGSKNAQTDGGCINCDSETR